MALAGWLCFLVLVLVLGNPLLTRQWSTLSSDGVGARWVRDVLSYPEWGLPGYPGALQGSLGLSVTIRTVLIVLVVGVLMFATARSMGARPACLGVMLTIWMAVVVGAGLVSALAAPVVIAAGNGGNFPSVDGRLVNSVLVAGGGGAAYGFWVGWLPALVAAPFGGQAARAAGATPEPAPYGLPAGR